MGGPMPAAGRLSSVYMGIISRREGWGDQCQLLVDCLVSTWVLYQGERDGGTNASC